MVYSSCGIPGCRSQTGQGLLFRRFPTKNCQLARQWLEKLPPSFRVNANKGVCELHFELSDFEQLRQCGKKKLKAGAVPRLFLGEPLSSNSPRQSIAGVRQPLGVVSSNSTLSSTPARKQMKVIVNTVARDHNYCRLKVNKSNLENQNPKDHFVDKCVSAVSLQPSHEVTSNWAAENLDHEKDEFFDCTDKILDSPCNPDSEMSCDKFTDGTGDFSNEIFLESLRNDHEKSGDKASTWKPNTSLRCQNAFEDKLTCGDLGDFSMAKSPSTPNAATPKEQLFVDLSNVTKENVLQLLRTQQAEINRLKMIASSKIKSNEYLRRVATNAKALSRKYNSLQKVNARLREKLRSRKLSPWLTLTQQDILLKRSNRGVTWDPELVRQGLIMKMKCGTSGYSAFVTSYPLLPSVRKLQDAIHFIRFESGLLHEVFDLLKVYASKCEDWEKDCQIVLDEMALQEGSRYDPSTKKMVGDCTFPTHTGRASKGLVIMLAGILKRWKVSVAVYLTSKKAEEFKQQKGKPNENHTGEAFAGILKEVLIRTEEIGLRVCGITSDMGPDNLAFWRAFGVKGSRTGNVKSSFPNPSRSGSEVFIMPDAVHLLKSIKSAMESNRTITLAPDVVEEEGLPSAVVDYHHIDDLLEYEENNELKVAFRLKKELVHCGKQFPKMKVGTTTAVICHRTGIGLKMLAEKTGNASYATTAWFIMLLNIFFELVTCRGGKLALSKSNPEAYERATELIKRVAYIFQTMKIGKGDYKPCQRGMRVLCNSLLGLQEYFLVKLKRAFLLLGRFTQDCIENLFSLVRLRQPTPNAVSFFNCLKVITIAQYSMAVKNSSYDYDEGDSIQGFDFLAEARRRALERAETRFYDSLEELFANPIDKVASTDFASMSELEQNVVYDMAGGVVHQLKKSNYPCCDTCINSLKHQSTEPHPMSTITSMKEFTGFKSEKSGPFLFYVSHQVFSAIMKAEITFRKYRQRTHKFQKLDVLNYFVDNLMYVWSEVSLPECHDIKRKLLELFFTARLKEYSKRLGHEAKFESEKAKTINRSSQSVAMRDAAAQITVASKQVNNRK